MEFLDIIQSLISTMQNVILSADAGWSFRQVADNIWVAYQSAGLVVRIIVPTGISVTTALLMKLLMKKKRKDSEEKP